MTVSAFSLYLTEELGVMGMFEPGVGSWERMVFRDGRLEQGTAVGKILGSGVFAYHL